MTDTAACITLHHPLNQESVACCQLLLQRCLIRDDVPLHWHTYYELELVLDGAGVQWINGRQLPLGAGSLYLMTPEGLHRLQARQPMDILSLKLPASGLPSYLQGMLGQYSQPAFCQLEPPAWEECRSDFMRIYREMQQPGLGGDACIHSLAALLLCALRRRDALHTTAPVPDHALMRMQTVMEYIQAHFREPLTLADTARSVGLTPNYLSARFTQVIGCGFSAYVAGLRVEYARQLLAQGNVSVTEAAFESGFGSLSHFLRTFKRLCGVSPGAYRRGTLF